MVRLQWQWPIHFFLSSQFYKYIGCVLIIRVCDDQFRPFAKGYKSRKGSNNNKKKSKIDAKTCKMQTFSNDSTFDNLSLRVLCAICWLMTTLTAFGRKNYRGTTTEHHHQFNTKFNSLCPNSLAIISSLISDFMLFYVLKNHNVSINATKFCDPRVFWIF